MKSKMLGLLAMMSIGLSACSQSRMGLAGRFEDVFLLDAVNLNGPRGSFVFQVNMTDNEGYLFATDLTVAVSRQSLRLLGRAPNGKYDILEASFSLDPLDENAYLVVKPKGSLNITEYSELWIETLTTGAVGVGLTPEEAAPGSGTLVVRSTMAYNDLESVLAQMNGGAYALAQ